MAFKSTIIYSEFNSKFSSKPLSINLIKTFLSNLVICKIYILFIEQSC